MQEVNEGALIRLKHNRHLLTKKQFYVLRRKVLNGDPYGAMEKLQALLLLQGSNAVKSRK